MKGKKGLLGEPLFPWPFTELVSVTLALLKRSESQLHIGLQSSLGLSPFVYFNVSTDPTTFK